MDEINVFLMGGTKESINIIKHLKKEYNSYILTTTTTEYGEKLAIEAGSDTTIAKPLPKDEIIDILEKNNFDLFIDATHPFASHVTQTAIEVSKICEIPYIRFERPTSKIVYEDNPNIHVVNSFEDAGKLIQEKFNKDNVLHFAGANTMKYILKYVSVENFYPRILGVKASIEKCNNLKIPEKHIVTLNGTSTVEENLKLIDKTNAKVIITKESGEIGGLNAKIQAANEKVIDVILIERPIIKTLKQEDIVSNLEELDKKIVSYI